MEVAGISKILQFQNFILELISFPVFVFVHPFTKIIYVLSCESHILSPYFHYFFKNQMLQA